MEEQDEMFTDEEIELRKKLIEEILVIAMPNLKIFIEEKLDEIRDLFQEFEDIKFNIATLSTLIKEKGLFNNKEFASCFKEIRKSFGIVDRYGFMEGKVIVTPYNWLED